MHVERILQYASIVLAIVAVGIERWIARNHRSYDPNQPYSQKAFDRYYFWIFAVVVFLSFYIGIFLSTWFAVERMPLIYAVPIGLLFFLVGYAIRLYAIQYLQSGFSVVLRVEKDQRLICSGPYKWVRHPSYTGSWLAVIGIALANGYPLVIVLVACSTLLLKLRRIRSEEAILAAHFPDYEQYRSRTKILIPFVL